MDRSAEWKAVSLLSLVGMLLFAAPVQASRNPGRDLPSSQDGGCATVNPCSGTTPFLAAFPAVSTLNGTNFTVAITPYAWGQVTTSGSNYVLSTNSPSMTLVNVVLTSSNPNVRMVAIAVGANVSNAGYVIQPLFSSPIPYTGSTSSNLSLSDAVVNADAGYTVWALGTSPPNNVALVFTGVPNTSTAPTQKSPTDVTIPYSVSSLTTNGLTQPSSSSSYAVVVYNGTGYEVVGGLALAGEPGPCGGTQVNSSVTCHTTTTNITLTGAGFTDLTRADNAPTSTAASTNTVPTNDTALCTNLRTNSSSMYYRETYSYTPATNQTVAISTAGSHYATVLTVNGGSVSQCSTAGLNGTDYQAALGSLALTANTQYTIIVGEYPPLVLSPGSGNTCDQTTGVCPFSTDKVLHFALTVTPDATTTAVVCSPGTVSVGQTLNCTATVADSTSATNTITGNVQFTFTPSGSSTPALTLTGAIASGTAKVSTTSLSAATYQVAATLQPSSGVFLGSTNSTSLVVALTSTSTSASASSSSPLAGANFNITGAVTGGSGSPQPTGTVLLFDGSTQVNSGIALASGAYSIPVSGAATGTHSYTVHYNGDTLYAASVSSAVPVVVGKDGSSVNLTSSGASVSQGASLTLTATISNSSGTSLSPTGTVTFMSGSSTVGTATVSGGTATLTTVAASALPGSHPITAQYAGDANFNASTSSAVPLTVLYVTTTTAGASSNSPVVGATVTVTASVGQGSGTQTPTGTLTLFDGTIQVGSPANVGSGTSSFPISNVTLGTHSYTVTYSGDAVYAASTSSVLQVVVGKDGSAVALSAPAFSVNQNGSIALTATVSNTSQTSLSATGTVIFASNGTAIGTTTLAGGVATLTTSAFTGIAGAYALTAQYSGDTNFNSSGSTSLAITVVAPDYTLKAETPSISIAQGQTGTSKIDLNAVGGYVQTITFSCTGLPANATCNFTPTTLTPDAAGDPLSSTLTITTDVKTAGLVTKSLHTGVLSCVLFGTLLVFSRRHRHLVDRLKMVRVLLAGFVLTGLTIAISGCGGGGGNGNNSSLTPVGTYTVSVTAGAGGVAGKSVALQVTITQ